MLVFELIFIHKCSLLQHLHLPGEQANTLEWLFWYAKTWSIV